MKSCLDKMNDLTTEQKYLLALWDLTAENIQYWRDAANETQS